MGIVDVDWVMVAFIWVLYCISSRNGQMFIVVVVFENFGGDGYSLPMRKSVSFFVGWADKRP